MASPPKGSCFISSASRSPSAEGELQLKRLPLPPPAEIADEPDPKGWNLIGMIDHRGGIGNAARANIRALKMLTKPRRIISFPSAHYPNPADLPAIHGHNYLHFNPCSRPIADLEGLPWFKDKINVGFWAWETTEAPARWLKYDRHMSQIWVPSHFVKGALERTGFKAPVFVIPHAIEPQPLHVYPTDRRQPLTFLVQFDGHSRFERKRPDLSIRAITSAALNAGENVRIIVKCHHDDGSKLALAEHTQVKIELQSKWLAPEQMEALWGRTDVFVSLNRGEGFGLPMVEAMSRGIAVVATAWGGSCDYMEPANSFPVTAERLEAAADSGDLYFKTGLWAKPCMEQAVHHIEQAMRQIRNGEIQKKAQAARATADRFSFENMRIQMEQAMKALA